MDGSTWSRLRCVKHQIHLRAHQIGQIRRHYKCRGSEILRCLLSSPCPALALVLPLHNPTRVPLRSKTQHHSTTPEAHPSSNSSEKLAGVDRNSNTESPARITASERASERAQLVSQQSAFPALASRTITRVVTRPRVVTGPAVARHPSPRTALSLRK